MHARLILNGKKADRPDVREAVKAVRSAGHDFATACRVGLSCEERRSPGGSCGTPGPQAI